MTLESYEKNTQWDLDKVSLTYETRAAEHDISKEFDVMIYTLELARKPAFFVYTLVIPCLLLTRRFINKNLTKYFVSILFQPPPPPPSSGPRPPPMLNYVLFYSILIDYLVKNVTCALELKSYMPTKRGGGGGRRRAQLP